jgi:hypothetical protein
MHVEQARLIQREAKCQAVTVSEDVKVLIPFIELLIKNSARGRQSYCTYHPDDTTVIDQLYTYYQERGFGVSIGIRCLTISWEKRDA